MLKPIQLGHHQIPAPVLLAPMSGITDLPYRRVATRLGAPFVISEMVASKELLKGTAQSKMLADFGSIKGMKVVQLAGRDPDLMADAARYCADQGADVIDLNFGCPVKKVVKGLGGAALLKDEALLIEITRKVLKATPLPVTIKTRLGWDQHSQNAQSVAKKAEQAGISMITIHGRTRDQFYEGKASWSPIKSIKNAISIPLIVNGDIVCTPSAREALASSGADGVMIGRAAIGRPWLAGELAKGLQSMHIPIHNRCDLICELIEELASHYGVLRGLRKARRHLVEAAKEFPGAQDRLADFYQADTIRSAQQWVKLNFSSIPVQVKL